LRSASNQPDGGRACVFLRLLAPGLGDLIQRNIFLGLLRRAMPSAEIVLVVGAREAERFGELFASSLLADRAIVCPPDGPDEALTAALAAERCAVCLIDPDSRGLGAELAARCGIPERIGIPTGSRDDAYITRPAELPRPALGRHDLYDYAVAVSRALGLHPLPRPADIVPRLRYRRRSAPRDAGVGPFVVLHPGGAKHWNRRWPLERFRALATRIIAELDGQIALVGAEDEVEETDGLTRTLLELHPDASVRSARGASIDATAALIDRSDLLVGNDSGPAHMAAALRTPSLVLHGPSGTAFMWARVYPLERTVSLGYDCQRIWNLPPGVVEMPCAHRCRYRYQGSLGPYPACLADIDLDTVWQGVLRTLRRAPARDVVVNT
jgi:ADP-heptose:LPS heptosyltransferase